MSQLELSFRRSPVVPALLFQLINASATLGQDIYSVTDLGTLGGTASYAVGLNNSCQIVGWSAIGGGTNHAFLYSDGAITDIDTFRSSGSFARGINESGKVAGYVYVAGNQHAFIFDTVNKMQDVHTIAGCCSEAYAINTSGQIVGIAYFDNVNEHAFLSTPGGAMTDLNTLGGSSCAAWAINDDTEIVGESQTADAAWHAFLYSGGISPISGLGSDWSEATGINNNRQVVGATGPNSTTWHPFLYDLNNSSAPINLGTLGGPRSTAFGINDNGWVVGGSFLTGNVQYHAFLYKAVGGITDLNRLIRNNSGWTLQEADAINDNCQIVGYGINPSGRVHGFLLSPVLGIDVSWHNGTIDWNKVKASGRSFAFVRATQGEEADGENDVNFGPNIRGAMSAGLLAGAYHVAEPINNAPEDEAMNFITVAGAYIGNSFLPPVLDLENDFCGAQANLTAWVRSWIAYVEQHTCVTPIIYSSKTILQKLENESPRSTQAYKLWIADYATLWDPFGTPSYGTSLTWANWQFKQYATDSRTCPTCLPGTCPGITGQVDLNSFNGSFSDLAALANPAAPPLFTGLGNGPIYAPLRGPFILEISAPDRNQIVVQVSEDLITWTDVATLSRNGCKFVFSDFQASTYAYRFYRVKP